jgi:hypothetical protein
LPVVVKRTWPEKLHEKGYIENSPWRTVPARRRRGVAGSLATAHGEGVLCLRVIRTVWTAAATARRKSGAERLGMENHTVLLLDRVSAAMSGAVPKTNSGPCRAAKTEEKRNAAM